MSPTQSQDREKLTKLIERLDELRAQQKITKAAYERLLKEYEAQIKEIDSTLASESTRGATLMAGASEKESTAPRIVSIEEGSSSSRPRIVESKSK